MRYRYKARSMDGKVHRGVIEASDSRALITYLDSIGLFCCSWKACEEAVSRHASIKSKHLSPLCRQMSVMLSAGLPSFTETRADDLILPSLHLANRELRRAKNHVQKWERVCAALRELNKHRDIVRQIVDSSSRVVSEK